MAAAATPSPAPATARDHGFHTLRVARTVAETADAASIVLDVPDDLREAFTYQAGQFCTFRCPIGDESVLRCYSMSSAPEVDPALAVTVKRVPGGLASNWLLDHLSAGDEIDVTLPAGVFCLSEARGAGDLVLFGGGSGITPVFSLVKSALATTDRPIRLLYANRDRDSVIFAAALDELAATHPDRFTVHHHLDAARGYLDADSVSAFAAGVDDADVYLCGPTPFMDLVEGALAAGGVAADRIHIERFTPGADPSPDMAADDTSIGVDAGPAQITIELNGRTETTTHHPGTTLLQAARQAGMSAPSSCESGSCATCMAMLVDGAARMHVNNALTEDEVEEGWVLTCQSVPTTPTVHVVYGYEED